MHLPILDAYSGSLVTLVIVCAFVIAIWLRVLLDVVRSHDTTILGRRLLLTSLGLVLNAVAILGIMAYRIWELIQDRWPFVWGVVAFYVLLAIGNIMFILSASLGTKATLLKWFVITLAIWLFILFIGILT